MPKKRDYKNLRIRVTAMTLVASGLIYLGLASASAEKENEISPVLPGITRPVVRALPSGWTSNPVAVSTNASSAEIIESEQARRVVVIPRPKARTRAS
ncbi:MAG: hypothetical protein QF898_02715, partial [SAR202 cluster bacterium]|nr:hypothetical protein [SAR202 cluster bacterium]